ncbi:4-hydroxybenzoate octaprenyltransferase [Chlamydia avium]|uniref:UbiA prenyltransferase family protein n=2 Tax=Chlamydia avium TaxID=1457141 RepID=W8JF79_9CHLA|nr:UbiA prenyltransferase family protein [Chlamydia avium 10DC88]VVT42799.1 4-hydroxybenzoate octaprenyltransferase [Chlamydia avium]
MTKSYISKLVNMKYSLFSIIFLSATTVFSLSFSEILLSLSFKKAFVIISLGFIAFIFARTFGIVINQIIDREIDKRNPRTSSRVLPMHQLSLRFCISLVLISSVVFLTLSFFFNTLCGIFSILACCLMALYPRTKCFTFLCHGVLGFIYYLAILINFLALSPGYFSWNIIIPASLWGMSVAMIITGNDIIYAIQDINFDKQFGLYSIPACFGKKSAIYIASACLIISLFSYLSLVFVLSFQPWVGISAILPTFVIMRTIKQYQVLMTSHITSERCFFKGNIYIALSFLFSMITLLISKL